MNPQSILLNVFPSVYINFTNKMFAHLVLYIVRKRAKIRNQYNQALHLTQDTNGKVTTYLITVGTHSIFGFLEVKGLATEASASDRDIPV